MSRGGAEREMETQNPKQAPGSELSVNVYLFEKESTRWGRGRERGRHRIQSRLQALSCADSSEPDAGLEPMNHEIMT